MIGVHTDYFNGGSVAFRTPDNRGLGLYKVYGLKDFMYNSTILEGLEHLSPNLC